MQLFEILLTYLITEYVDYAIDLGIQSVPIPESSTQRSEIYFFEIVQQTNVIVHLMEKLINDNLFPLIGLVLVICVENQRIGFLSSNALNFDRSTAKIGDCLSRKKYILEQTELKLDTGLDRWVLQRVKKRKRRN